MDNKIYSEYVEVSPELDKQLKKSLINHLVIYNYSLSQLHTNPEITFKNLMKSVHTYIDIRKMSPVILLALMNEIYYQFKKFKRNIRMQKLVTDIQYFTFIGKIPNCNNLKIDLDKNTIKIDEFSGEISLTKPLPEVDKDLNVYYNISYSNTEDRYKLTIYAVNH